VPKGQLARFAKYRRRAERQGSLGWVEARGDDISEAWKDVARLHRARFPESDDCALGDPRLVHFHHRAVSELAPVCSTVDAVTLAASVIAGLYGFIVGEVKYCYLQGIDTTYARISPGLLLVGLVLENAQKKGIQRVDFLRGAEPYKLEWGARVVTNARRRLWQGAGC
jgi:CelD/BcsL family acetyltransferase involved in cellulose biosynthesis